MWRNRCPAAGGGRSGCSGGGLTSGPQGLGAEAGAGNRTPRTARFSGHLSPVGRHFSSIAATSHWLDREIIRYAAFITRIIIGKCSQSVRSRVQPVRSGPVGSPQTRRNAHRPRPHRIRRPCCRSIGRLHHLCACPGPARRPARNSRQRPARGSARPAAAPGPPQRPARGAAQVRQLLIRSNSFAARSSPGLVSFGSRVTCSRRK
jgi:hypothetical protein